MVPGSSALAKTSVKWPSRRGSTASTDVDEVACGVAVVVLPGDQVHGDLGVGVAGELDTVGFQFRRSTAKFSMIPLWTTAILPAASRCGWALRSVGLPWVAHRVWPRPVLPARLAAIGLGQRRLQVGQPARAARDGQAAVTVEQRDARRVVAAVLHPAQRVDDDVAGRTLPDVADDSTHSHPG